jgi:hypothetical protein
LQARHEIKRRLITRGGQEIKVENEWEFHRSQRRLVLIFYSQHLISLYHSSHCKSYFPKLPLSERIRLRYHMLSFFPTRGASHTLWNDQKPRARAEEEEDGDELVERKTFFFLFPHCVHQAQEENRKREKKLKMILHNFLRSDIFPFRSVFRHAIYH